MYLNSQSPLGIVSVLLCVCFFFQLRFNPFSFFFVFARRNVFIGFNYEWVRLNDVVAKNRNPFIGILLINPANLLAVAFRRYNFRCAIRMSRVYPFR